MIRVVLADDHNLMRAGLKNLINLEPGIEVVGETNNPFDVIETIKKSKCDIIVLDLSMPGKNGIDVLRDIKQEIPEVKVLILSMYPEEQFAKRTLKAGADGYLTKVSAPDVITIALRRIASGGKFITPVVAEILASDFNNSSDKPLHELLSEREFQVLLLLADGKAQSEIADELSLSATTINTYRNRILEKLQIKTTAELIKYALNNKLIDGSL